MAGASKPSAGTQKMVVKLQLSVEAGAYYDAQQMYKSVHSRYVAQRKYQEALDLIQSGACLQLKHGQVTCGAELATLLVDTYQTIKVPVSPEYIDQIRAIYECFPRQRIGEAESKAAAPDSDQVSGGSVGLEGQRREGETEKGQGGVKSAAKMRLQACTDFLKAALKWSANHGGPPGGSPELHDMLADYMWNQSSLTRVDFFTTSKHFVQGTRVDIFVEVLAVVMNLCLPGEVDLVVTRAVLQYLAIRKLTEAKQVAEMLRAKERAFAIPPIHDTPLLHWITFVLEAVEKKSYPLFKMLENRYRPSIARDPVFRELVEDVAEKCFGVRKGPASPMAGILGDMMKMLGDDGA
eukprot:TRINITY_DN385_c0_g8_i1.p1 TRINITY_DN385_c0_g8~~TRINITY_DN385_c0_g8_i1.p1  ORF type:complete len:351 (-),score=63.11 TRINITY_DN385_c0_g8_i1:311-1363(-)